MLRAAAAAAQAGLRLAPHAVERLARDSRPMPVPWPAPARDALVSLLGAGRPAIPVWEALDQADLWSRLIPGVVGGAQRPAAQPGAPVHRRPPPGRDRRAVGGPRPRGQPARPAARRRAAARHRQGPARRPHRGRGRARRVDRTAARLRRRTTSTSSSRWSSTTCCCPRPRPVATSTTRPRWPPSPRPSATQDVLDLLHALTEADAAATGPAAWSDWKKSLIDELVARTREVLAGRPRPADPRTTSAQRMLAAAVRATSAERRGRAARRRPGQRDHHRHGGRPRPHRSALHRRRGALAAPAAGPRRADRHRDRRRRRPPGGAGVDRDPGVRRPAAGRAAPRGHRPRRLRQPRRRRAARRPGAGLPGAAGHGARRGWTWSRAPASGRPCSRCAPTTPPALLHRVTRAIAAADVAIIAARAATLGSEVVDVFYLVDRDGAPLSRRPHRHGRASPCSPRSSPTDAARRAAQPGGAGARPVARLPWDLPGASAPSTAPDDEDVRCSPRCPTGSPPRSRTCAARAGCPRPTSTPPSARSARRCSRPTSRCRSSASSPVGSRERALGAEVSKALNPAQQVVKIVHEELVGILGGETRRLRLAKTPPTVILLAGLQGAGKTTLAGKLALHLREAGHTPLLVAADLQRPNAVDQLLRGRRARRRRGARARARQRRRRPGRGGDAPVSSWPARSSTTSSSSTPPAAWPSTPS